MTWNMVFNTKYKYSIITSITRSICKDLIMIEKILEWKKVNNSINNINIRNGLYKREDFLDVLFFHF